MATLERFVSALFRVPKPAEPLRTDDDAEAVLDPTSGD